MSAIFNCIYLLLFIVLSPWMAWRYLFRGKNRRGWKHKLLGLVPVRQSNRSCIWLHAVSVGEVNLLKPLIVQLTQQYPDIEIAISTTTETGFDLASKKYSDQIVFFCPMDFSWAVKNTLKRLKPDLLLLAELELWPNLVSICHSKSVPVALVNGRISSSSFSGYRRLRPVFARLLKRIELAIVQTDLYRERLIQLGMDERRVNVCGNLKFDGLSNERIEPTESVVAFANQAQLAANDFVLVAGSTQEEEDRIAIDLYQHLKPEFPQLRLVLVPRHPDRGPAIAAELRRRSIPSIFRSSAKLNQPNQSAGPSPVIVVDVIGELQYWWGRAGLAYVGGSRGKRGGQNIIEPAALGVPVCFGRSTENFKDVVDMLLADNAAEVVDSISEWEQILRRALNRDAAVAAMAKRGQQLVESQRGSTQKTVELLAPIIRRIENRLHLTAKAA